MELENLKEAKKTWEAEQKKWTDLHIERDRVQSEIDDLDNRIQTTKQNKKNQITEAAEMLLAGNYNKPSDVDPLMTQRDDLALRRRIILEAIKLQEKNVDEARRQYSSLYGKSRRGEYVDIIRENVKAVINLSRAVDKETAFRNQFSANGLSFFRNPLNFSRIGTLKDRFSRASMYLDEVKNSGLISKEEIEKMKAA
jgi:hypothetical protein